MNRQNQKIVGWDITFTFFRRNLKVRSIILVVLLEALVGLPFFLLPPTQKAGTVDKLSDFQDAVKEEGCKAIPYQRERIECDNRSKAKDNTCKNFGCNRAEVEKIIDDLRDNMRKLQNAERYNDQQSIDSLTAKIQNLREKLEEQIRFARDRIGICEDCLAARENVQRIFSDVKKMVEEEKEPELQPFISVLVQKFENGRKAHDKDPTKEVIYAWDTCKWISEIKVNEIRP